MSDRQFSPEEAEKIFAGAARRQQEARAKNDPHLTLEELEAAARDAGIEAKFVRAAAADLLRPSHASHVRKFADIPVEVRQSKILPAPLTAVDWGAVVTGLRSTFGKQGMATDLGTVREWTSDAAEGSMPARVVIEPDDGGIRVTIERKMWPSVVGILSGMATTLSVGLIIAGIWIAGATPNPMWVPALVLALFSVAFGLVGHRLLKREGRKTLKRFDAAMHLIEKSIDATVEVRAAKGADAVPHDRVALPDPDGFNSSEYDDQKRTERQRTDTR